MIEIICKYESDDVLSGITVAGHAEFPSSDTGGDIVCSAVSALVGFLGITFSEMLSDLGTVGADDGAFELILCKGAGADPRVQSMLKGWVCAVRQLEENYSGWVKVEDVLEEIS